MKKRKENYSFIKCPYCGTENEEKNKVCKSCGRLMKEIGSPPKDFRPIGALLIILALVAVVGGGVYFIFKNKDTIISATQTFFQFDHRKDYSQSNNSTNDYGTDDDYIEIYDNKEEKNIEESQYLETMTSTYSENLTDYGLYKDGHGIDEYDYVIADSDSRYLTQDDIDKLTLRGINYAKNEIYARHGRDFKSSELQRFFSSRYWYKVQYSLTNESDAKITNSFNQYEKENSRFLNEVETRLGTYDLDK